MPKYNKMARRREFALSRMDPTKLAVLEIGALNSPTFTKDKVDISFADWLTKEELEAHYPNKANIRPVDYVIGGNGIAASINDRFDLIIAHHVIEHIPDVIGWMQQLAMLSNPAGRLFLAVPDRRYTFDLVRRETDLAQLIDCYESKITMPTFYQLFSHLYYKKNIVADDVWSGADLAVRLREKRFSIEGARARAAQMFGEYHSVHCHVFTKDSFVDLFTELESTEVMPWRLAAVDDVQPGGNEFLVLFDRCVK